MLNRMNLFLAIALALVIVALLLMRVDHSRPNFQINMGDDMTYSPAYSPFEKNENFPNGRTMQSPVPGTLAQGAMPLHYEATPADAIRAGEELVNPFDQSTEAGTASTQRGEAVFSVVLRCLPRRWRRRQRPRDAAWLSAAAYVALWQNARHEGWATVAHPHLRPEQYAWLLSFVVA